MKLRIASHLQTLAVMHNRPITPAYVSRETGLAYETVRRLDTNRRIDMRTLEAILGFLRTEGLHDLTVGDLFVELPSNGHEAPD